MYRILFVVSFLNNLKRRLSFFYLYFPEAAVRTDWLEKAAKTEDDRMCPHGVQFYDVVIEGARPPRVPRRARSNPGGLAPPDRPI